MEFCDRRIAYEAAERRSERQTQERTNNRNRHQPHNRTVETTWEISIDMEITCETSIEEELKELKKPEVWVAIVEAIKDITEYNKDEERKKIDAFIDRAQREVDREDAPEQRDEIHRLLEEKRNNMKNDLAEKTWRLYANEPPSSPSYSPDQESMDLVERNKNQCTTDPPHASQSTSAPATREHTVRESNWWIPRMTPLFREDRLAGWRLTNITEEEMRQAIIEIEREYDERKQKEKEEIERRQQQYEENELRRQAYNEAKQEYLDLCESDEPEDYYNPSGPRPDSPGTPPTPVYSTGTMESPSSRASSPDWLIIDSVSSDSGLHSNTTSSSE